MSTCCVKEPEVEKEISENKIKNLVSKLHKSNVQLHTFSLRSKKLSNMLGLNKNIENTEVFGYNKNQFSCH